MHPSQPWSSGDAQSANQLTSVSLLSHRTLKMPYAVDANTAVCVSWVFGLNKRAFHCVVQSSLTAF